MKNQLPGPIQPWLLLGDRRHRILESRVRSAVERWAGRWVASPLSLSITIEPASQGGGWDWGARNAGGFGVRRKSGECVSIGYAPRCLTAWAAGLGPVILSAVTDPSEDSIAADAEFELVKGLWNEFEVDLAAADSKFERVSVAEGAQESEALAARGVHLACLFGALPGFGVHWLLSASMVAAMLAEGNVPRVADSLTSRRAAVAQSAVALDCYLGCIQVPVRDLHSLRLGDVLLTEVTLETPAELRVRNGVVAVAKGAIGESNGRRAIKIESANRGL